MSDGSCNGLQHYTALGRDKIIKSPSLRSYEVVHFWPWLSCSCIVVKKITFVQLGAAAVNLVAGEKPVDVYSGIAASVLSALDDQLGDGSRELPHGPWVELMNENLYCGITWRVLDITRRDAKKDPATDPNASRARLLINQVDRKLVKQMVMTSVYGVTYIGARDQIKKRLKDRCAIEDDDELIAASCYAAKWIQSLQMGFSVADLSSKLNVAKERLRGSGDDIAAADYADALKPSVVALPLHGFQKQQKHNFHMITVITLLLSELMRAEKKLKET
ncbi:unnamed protein product [Camellia sinensis]